jgi:hypothetical protein
MNEIYNAFDSKYDYPQIKFVMKYFDYKRKMIASEEMKVMDSQS